MPIEVSSIAGVTACPEPAFLPLYCSGVVRLARICAGSWRGIQIQTALWFSRFGYEELQMRGSSCKFSREIKKAAPQGTKGFCRRCTAAKWFGVVAERRFITVKWFIWVRGYHERGRVSIVYL